MHGDFFERSDGKNDLRHYFGRPLKPFAFRGVWCRVLCSAFHVSMYIPSGIYQHVHYNIQVESALTILLESFLHSSMYGFGP